VQAEALILISFYSTVDFWAGLMRALMGCGDFNFPPKKEKYRVWTEWLNWFSG
jgi:hypothetical protein